MCKSKNKKPPEPACTLSPDQSTRVCITRSNNIKAKEGKLKDWKFSLYKNEYSIVDVFAYPFMAQVIRYFVVSCKKLHIPSSDERKNFNVAAICECTTCRCGTKEHKDLTEYLKSKKTKIDDCKDSKNSGSDSGSSNSSVIYHSIRPKKLDESIEGEKHFLKSFKTKKRKTVGKKKRKKEKLNRKEKVFKLMKKVKIRGIRKYPLYELLAALRMRGLKLGPLMKKIKPEPLKLFSKALKIVFMNGSKYEGYFDQMMINGFGRLRYKNGSAYKGKFKNGLAHGFGMMTWNDGSYYQGTLKKNLKHGHGSFVFLKNGRSLEETNIYKAHFGEWKNGLKQNHGLTVFGKSNWYEGNWDNGLMNGFGIRCYKEGCYYIGNWKDGRRNGYGIMMWPNKDMYQGNWVNGKMDGIGTYIWKAFRVTEWLISPFQNSYAGEWKNGLRHGKGTLYLSTGAKVIANWKKGKKHGYGEILCTNGKKIIKNKLFHHDKLVDTKEPIFVDQPQDENERSKKIALKYFELDTTDKSSSDELLKYDGYLPEYVAINAPIYTMDFDSHIYKIFVPDACPDIYPDGTDFSKWVSTGKRLSIYCLEREWLQKVIIKRGPELNFIYNKYATGGSSKEFQFNPALMRISLWKMLRDGGLFLTKKSLVDFDKEVGVGDKPFDQIPMFEMVHYLLILSWEVFAKQKFCNPNIPGIVASAFDRFIEDVMVPVAHGYCGNILMLFRYVPLKALFSLFNSIKKPFTIVRLLKVFKPVEDSFRDILPRPSKFIRKLAKGLNVIHPNGSLDYLPIHDTYFELVYQKKTSVIIEGSDLSLLGLLGYNIFFQVLLEVLPNVVTLEGTIRKDYEITFLDFCDILSELIVIYLDKVHGDLNDEDLVEDGEQDEDVKEKEEKDPYEGERVDEEDEDSCCYEADDSTNEEKSEHFYDILGDDYYDDNDEDGRKDKDNKNEKENNQEIANEVEGEISGYCKDRLRFKMYVKKSDDESSSNIGGCTSDVYLSGEENQLLDDLRFVDDDGDDDDEVIDDEEEDAACEKAFADFMACEDKKSEHEERVEESDEEEYLESEAQKECPPEHECLEPISKALLSENEVKSDIEDLSEKIRDCFEKNVLESNAVHFQSFLNILLGSKENYKDYPCMAYLKKSKKLIYIFNNLVKKSGLLHKKRFDFIKSRLECEFIKKFINNKLKHGSHESPPLQDTPSDSEISDDSSENSDTFYYNNFFQIDSDSSDDWGGWSDSSTNTDATKKSSSSYKETVEEISSVSTNSTFTTLVDTDADNSKYELNYSATDEESELIRGSSTSSPITDTLTSRSDETSIGITNLSIICSETNALDSENESDESIVETVENSENNEHKPILVVHETEKSREGIKQKAEILKSKITEALFGEGNGREEYNKLLTRLGGNRLLDELRDSLKKKMGINEVIFNKEESLESESDDESESTSDAEKSKSMLSRGSFLESTSELNESSDKKIKRTKNYEFDRYIHMFTLKSNRPIDYEYFFDLPPIKHPLIVGHGFEGCSSDDDRDNVRKQYI